MHRFYLPPGECQGGRFELTGREAHHALHVVRLRPGDLVCVLDGAGSQLDCTVAQTSRHTVWLEVQRREAVPPMPYSVTLLQAIPKAKIIESIIQKATELGTARIVPLISERVVAHLDLESGKQKAEKWQQVAIEAIKQCGNAWLPKVEPPITPREWLARREAHELCLIGSLRPGSKHPREWMEAFSGTHGRPPTSLCIWVGPEGDFTSSEYDAAEASGARPITLGRLVLRSETAATYCLSVLNYEMQWHCRTPAE